MKIYTSYDGDLIPQIDLFIKFVLLTGNVPFNPTKLLSYYLSTKAHNNSKLKAVEDCISIEFLADELWIFKDSEFLPEGVLLETLYWMHNKKGLIRVFPLDVIIPVVKSINKNFDVSDYEVSNKTVMTYFRNSQIMELQEKDFTSGNLRPTIFLDIPDSSHKYIDWVKLFAFKQGFVPIDPKSMVSKIDIDIFSNLSHKAFYNVFEQAAHKSIPITQIPIKNSWSLQEAKVPKYVNKNWALTAHEKYNT